MTKVKFIPSITKKGENNDITDYRIHDGKHEIGWIVTHMALTPIGLNKIAFIFVYFPLPKKEQLQVEKQLKDLGYTIVYELKCAWSLDRV